MILSEFLLIRILIFEIILKYNTLKKPLSVYNEISSKNSKIIASILYHILMTYIKKKNPFIENN